MVASDKNSCVHPNMFKDFAGGDHEAWVKTVLGFTQVGLDGHLF